ncbi:MAG: TIGR04255 family protein [Pseudomonadota bacterium]|nr:TIGR04255 family protein [Pseudomonadota bacterium]
MSGCFKKAPLVYVTARVRVSQVPPLSDNQLRDLQQDLMQHGLVHPKQGQAQEIAIQIEQRAGITPQPTLSQVTRYGFFSKDKTKSLIIDKNHIEWRSSSYSKYGDFIKGLNSCISAINRSVEPLQYLAVEEISLSYADIIVPNNSRKLADYFDLSDQILPLSFIDEPEDIFQFGQVQVTRIVKTNQQITINLEQLPIQNGRIGKILPQDMGEPDNNFAMPITLRDEWLNSSSNDYALLMSRAAQIIPEDCNLKNFLAEEQFKELHITTKDTFTKLLNKKVCYTDWEYSEEQ